MLAEILIRTTKRLAATKLADDYHDRVDEAAGGDCEGTGDDDGGGDDDYDDDACNDHNDEHGDRNREETYMVMAQMASVG